MPVVRECSHPGCTTLTMGELCLAHEAVVECDDDELALVAALAYEPEPG